MEVGSGPRARSARARPFISSCRFRRPHPARLRRTVLPAGRGGISWRGRDLLFRVVDFDVPTRRGFAAPSSPRGGEESLSTPPPGAAPPHRPPRWGGEVFSLGVAPPVRVGPVL